MALHPSTGPPSPRDRPRAPAAPVRTNPAHLTVLVADPEADARGVESGLHDHVDVDVVVCGDGAEALFLAGSGNPDVVVLSADLPVVPAADVVRAIRTHVDTPVYLAIGAGEAEAVRPVLAVGGTGVLNRPYERRELVTLVETHMARVRTRLDQEAVLRLGRLELDSPAFEVRGDGQPLDLTLREFELLRFLMLHADRAVTQEQIRTEVWGARGEAVTANTIAVHIGRLRVRLEGAAEIIGIRGVGYRLTPAP